MRTTVGAVLAAPMIFLWLTSCGSADKLLLAGARSGDEEQVRSALKQGASVNAAESGQTALMQAGWHRRAAIVKLLLARGADVNAKSKHGETALIQMSMEGKASIVRILINAQARVNDQDKRGMTALMRAANEGHLDVLRILLKAGARINLRNAEGGTALSLGMAAAAEGRREAAAVVRVLRARGARK